jgi:RNA polymerase-binding protein DksA
MASILTHDQRALIEAALVRRRQQLNQELSDAAQHEPAAEQAGEVPSQDNEAPQREAQRELEMQLGDRRHHELDAVGDALRRLQRDDFGQCNDCGAAIAFERLQAEPWALQCVGCASARERDARNTR